MAFDISSYISVGVGALLIAIGILSFLSARVRSLMRNIPIGNPQLWAIAFIVVGFLAGGIGYYQGLIGGVSTASIIQKGEVVDNVGLLTVKLHDGLNNASTSSDYLNDEEDFMTIYSVDADIEGDEEIKFNATIYREKVGEDANLKVSCTIDDKELSGVTVDNLADKTGGQIDLDINDAGTHSDDNTVWLYKAYSESTNELEFEIAFDQEETYHDGMSDLDDYIDVKCIAESGSQSVDFTLRVLANS